MTCNCHPDWHDLGVHAPTPAAPNLAARLDEIRAQTSPGTTGPDAAGETVAPGDSTASQLVPGSLPGVLALVALVVGVLAFGWWAL